MKYKSLINKYKKLGFYDSSYYLYNEEIDFIKSEFANDKEAYVNAVEQARERLLKNSIVANINFNSSDMRRRYSTWKRHQELLGNTNVSKIDYLEIIESINAFRDINDFFESMTSDEIAEFYALGRTANLSSKKIRERLEENYNNNLEKGFTVNKIKQIMRDALRE